MSNKTEINDWSDDEKAKGYKVLKPTDLYGGKGYADWVCDWFNWFFSANPDSHNSGPVVFLKSFPTPSSSVGDESSDESNSDANGSSASPAKYMNRPNVMVGGDGLQIFEDQAVLLPIINSFWIATEPYADLGYMHGYTTPNTDHCVIDPDQIKIDFDRIVLPKGTEITRDFRISTSVFTAVIPDSGYGISLKDYMGIPMPPGPVPAIVEGYFILLKFIKREEEGQNVYRIESLAQAPDDHSGHYFADLLYEITVLKRSKGPPKASVKVTRPPQNEALIRRKLNEKVRHGELTQPQADSFLKKS